MLALRPGIQRHGSKLAGVAVFWGQWKIISSWRWASEESAWPTAEEREPYRGNSMGRRARKSEEGVRRLLPGPVYSISDKRTAKEFRVRESNSRLWVTNVQCRGMNREIFFFIWKPPFGIYYVIVSLHFKFSSVTKKSQLLLMWYKSCYKSCCRVKQRPANSVSHFLQQYEDKNV